MDYDLLNQNLRSWNEDEDILMSIERRALAKTKLEDSLKSKPEGVQSKDLWALLSKPPIWNSVTIYATFMCPRSGTLKTRVPLNNKGFKRG